MAQLVKLYDEKELLITLQADTLILIRDCKSIGPIKKFVECYDVLKLTFDIQEKFPREHPDPLECDETALLHLKKLIQELFVFFGPELPRPGFDSFDLNVRKLLQLFKVPRRGAIDVRDEKGEGIILFTTETNMSHLYVVDGRPPGPDSKK